MLTLQSLAQKIQSAETPEEVFEQLSGTMAQQKALLSTAYRGFSKICHPESNPTEVELATQTFTRLHDFYQEAQRLIEAGTYGVPRSTNIALTLRGSSYQVGRKLFSGDLAEHYQCTPPVEDVSYDVICKITRDPADNDLARNEAKVLQHLFADGPNLTVASFFFPNLEEDSFLYEEDGISRQANLLKFPKNLYSLEEVALIYPHGVPTQDIAWIFRRLLSALSVAHSTQVIHGAVLPPHILIQPATHDLILCDWGYALLNAEQTKSHLMSVVPLYTEAYPGEVWDAQTPDFSLDLYLAAYSMLYLIGEQSQAPLAFLRFLEGCRKPGGRSKDATALRTEFTELIDRLWERKFHEFTMPAR